jgi:hypothetical protein
MTTQTMSTAATVAARWRRVRQKPSTFATAVWLLFNYGCSAIRHTGGCGLVNQRFSMFFRGESDEPLIEFRNPFYRIVRWASDKSDSWRSEPIDS